MKIGAVGLGNRIAHVYHELSQINKEAELYKYMPINKTFFKVDNHYFRIQNQMEKTLNNENKVKKVLGKKTFILIK